MPLAHSRTQDGPPRLQLLCTAPVSAFFIHTPRQVPLMAPPFVYNTHTFHAGRPLAFNLTSLRPSHHFCVHGCVTSSLLQCAQPPRAAMDVNELAALQPQLLCDQGVIEYKLSPPEGWCLVCAMSPRVLAAETPAPSPACGTRHRRSVQRAQASSGAGRLPMQKAGILSRASLIYDHVRPKARHREPESSVDRSGAADSVPYVGQRARGVVGIPSRHGCSSTRPREAESQGAAR